MELRKVKKICYSVVGIILVSMVFIPYYEPVPGIIGCVFLIAFGIFILISWRCPYCGRSLGKLRVRKLERCPHCRKKLDV